MSLMIFLLHFVWNVIPVTGICQSLTESIRHDILPLNLSLSPPKGRLRAAGLDPARVLFCLQKSPLSPRKGNHSPPRPHPLPITKNISCCRYPGSRRSLRYKDQHRRHFYYNQIVRRCPVTQRYNPSFHACSAALFLQFYGTA